jgi:lactate permease
MNQTWVQNYDPLGNATLSTLVAAAPVFLLFYLLAVRKTIAWRAAVYAFLSAVLIAALVFRMPAHMLGGSIASGFVYAAIQIAWILVAAVFVYEITVETGHFKIIMESIGAVTDDRRLQVLLIAFAFGAVLEGSGGGGAPVAVCGAMLVGLGFKPFDAALMCLLANTAPVAWGGMGNPIRTLAAVTGLGEPDLSAMTGRILPWISAILPFWLVRTQCNWRDTMQVWPGLAFCGLVFAGTQFVWSNYIDSTLVDIMGGLATIVLTTLFLRVWKPKSVWRYANDPPPGAAKKYTTGQIVHAWSPFLLLAAFVIVWGLPFVKPYLDATTYRMPVPGLHKMVLRVPPVVAHQEAENAVIDFASIAAVGTATFFAGLIAGPIQGLSIGATLRIFFRTLYRMRTSLAAIGAMIGLGFVTRYSGMDAVMGLALTKTGWTYPIFGTLIGWLGVALTGTDAGSNALFGSLQVITARNLNLSPVLMAAANTAGGVMGKMIGAQSVIVGCAATGIEGKEGDLFRAVIKHSIPLALLVGLIVFLYAYVFPGAIPSGHRYW